MKVLIAEDEHQEAKALQILLRKYYPEQVEEIVVVDNGLDAVKAAQDERPDLVFMDIHMPGLNGLLAGREIRAENDEVEIIMLTAYADFDYARQAIGNRILDYLVKPYSVKTLRQAVDQAVTRVEHTNRQRRAKESSQRLTGLLQREFLHKIIVNFRLREDIILRHAKMLGVDSHCYRLLFFEATGSLPPDQAACEDLFSRLRQAGVKFMHTAFNNTMCVIPHALAEESLGKALDRVIHDFADANPELSFYASDTQTRWEELAAVYHRTLSRFIAPDGDDGGKATPVELEKRLAGAVLAHDADAASGLCRALVEKAYQKYGTSNDFGFILLATFRTLLRRISLQEDAAMEGLEDWIDGNFRIPYRGDRERAHEDLKTGVEMIMASLSGNAQGRGAQVVRQVKQYLEAHFSKPVSLNHLARLTGMSKFHLSRTFKSFENETITGYLQYLRMEKAKLLLAQGEPVSTVCFKCGFSDPAYFGRSFKKMVGIPPAAFSRQNRD